NPDRSTTHAVAVRVQRARRPPSPTLFPYTTLFRSSGPDARVYFTEPVPGPAGFQAEQTTALVSVRLDGSMKRTHARVTTRGGGPVMYVSPPDDAPLVLDRDDLYAIPLTPAGADGQPVDRSPPSVPVQPDTPQSTSY